MARPLQMGDTEFNNQPRRIFQNTGSTTDDIKFSAFSIDLEQCNSSISQHLIQTDDIDLCGFSGIGGTLQTIKGMMPACRAYM